MTLLFAVFLGLHGLIHLLGAAKAFGWAALPQLTRPISPTMGGLWLAAAVLFGAAAAALFVWPRGWWAIGAVAIVVSTIAIAPSWADAKVGAVANAIALVGVAYGFLVTGPFSMRAEYDRIIERGLARAASSPSLVVGEADLAMLPPPVRRYLRAAGVVGQPRVTNFRARMRGRIRSGPGDPWMTFAAEQHNFFDEPSRYFYMDAWRSVVPVKVFHRYEGTSATMRARVAGLVPVVDAAGAEMDQAETVTLFNDMCIFAPATLIDPAIGWEPVDAHTARATFTNAGHTIRADLVFNDAGELVDFWSDDRRRASTDGRTLDAIRWSTPVTGHRSFGAVRLASRGEGRWHEPAGEYAYIELEIHDVAYNVRP
jgi:hypothetical protein